MEVRSLLMELECLGSYAATKDGGVRGWLRGALVSHSTGAVAREKKEC